MAIFLFAGHSNADPGATGVRGRTEAVETIALRDMWRKPSDYYLKEGL